MRAGVLRARADGVCYMDAGAKALNLDCGMPEVAGRPDLACTKASDEQGRIEAADAANAPVLGESLSLIPSHCDPTVALYGHPGRGARRPRRGAVAHRGARLPRVSGGCAGPTQKSIKH